MLKEIQNNDNFNKVFDTGKSATQNVTISEKGASHSYILLGYPMQSQDRKHTKFSGVFIYQDLKQLKILIMQLPLLF